MNCRDYQQLIQRLLDGHPAATYQEDLSAHLAICSDCHELDAAAHYLLDGLRFLAPPQPPAGLRERICRQVMAERIRTTRRRRLLVRSAVAAALLLAGSVIYLASRTAERMEGSPALAAVRRGAASTTSTSLHRRIEEAGLAIVALTRRTADETVGQTRFFLPVNSGGDPRRENSAHAPPESTRRLASRQGDDLDTLWAQALAPPARSLREIQDGMAAGLEPVASSARRAVGFFLREIPSAESRMQ
jgi:hypothetical protein